MLRDTPVGPRRCTARTPRSAEVSWAALGLVGPAAAGRLCYGKKSCYAAGQYCLGKWVSPWLLEDHMEIDAKRLTDDAYRYDVLTALVRDYQVGIMRYCVTRLGEDIGEEVAQEVFVTAWDTL